MIPKSNKFPARTEFLAFRARARQLMTPHARIYHLESNALARLTVIVPKKLSKLATTRNWLKRLTYNTLWPHIQKSNLDMVVIYKPLPLKKSPANTQQIISELTHYVSVLS